jgi:gliding motility-associated-like protein
MKKIFFYFFILFLLCLNFVKAQTSILIYSENFENGAPGVTLNTSGVGNNSGINKWIINNEYNGTPIYPNTPDQNQTSGGTISFAPYGHYLHIYDQNTASSNGISNCNYDPTATSDRFIQLTSDTNGFCTLGMDSVKIAFFHIGMGSGTAQAELYYSADNGPWIQTGTIYNNQPIWKYEVVQNTAFDNKANLRFGFRWVNNAGSLPGNSSIGIDDIFIKGYFDNFVTNFNVVIDSLKPNPICQNFNLSIYYHLTVPICGTGFFGVELSDASGSFSSSSVPTLFYQLSNQNMNGYLPFAIPSNTPAGTCYKVRIYYYFTDYSLNFYSTASICFEVQQCPNTIITLQPVVTMVGSDSVCVGSVIDVPFWSTGVFQNGNNYIAELSDSAGNFSSNLNVLGTSPDHNTYDPLVVPAPGSVSGLINENNQPIPDGCNYWIRVRSTAPPAIGMVWGPFCLKHCDIETNHKLDIHACLHSCAVGPEGFDTTVYVDIHMFNALNNTDTSAVYDPANNQFLLEVHESQFFAVIPPVGGLGSITADNDTTLHIHVPCADSLHFLGLKPGLYYLRIIATNSNHPLDVNGTLIRLLIGAPADSLWIYQVPPDSVLCLGDAVYFYPIPYNAYPPMNSTYQWYVNGSLFSSDPAIGILFNGAGTYNLTVQETNYGCKGLVTPNSTSLYVLGPPNVNISGPNQVCLGDTIHYQVPFQTGVYYEWSTSGGIVIDTSNNELNILFNIAGVYNIHILCLNKCGQAIGVKNIIVTAYPDAQFSVTSPVCSGANSVINYTGTPSSPPVTYSWNFDSGVGVPGGNNPGPQNVSWNNAGIYTVILTVTKYGCATLDSNVVNVLQSPIPNFNFYNQCLGETCVFTDSSQGNPNSWVWNFGDGSLDSSQSNPTHHIYADTGSYSAQLVVSSANGCKDTLIKNVIIYNAPTSVFTTKTPICVGENSLITYAGNAPPTATYTWIFPGGTVISGTGQGPYEISWPGLGTYNIGLSISENNCNSNNTNPVIVSDCIIIVPNIFTPNGDGENDVFYIKGLDSYQNSKLQIYNRWGNKIYESDDYKNNWDGDNNPDGVFYYVLTLQNGTSLHGTVTILK